MVYFDLDTNTPEFTYVLGPSDYNRGPYRKSRVIETPFWIQGYKPYPKFDVNNQDPNIYLSYETYLSFDNGSLDNMLMRIALQMYTMREHWSERMNAATLRMSTLKDIQMVKMSLSMDIEKHTMQNATGRGTIAPTT